jgi:prepilin-type N-terminal cleavage/methylation domain-containing protein
MKRIPGFTLIELLLVVAILAILTAVILPKFDGLQSKVNHGVGAASADDTSRLIVTYKVTKNKYPDGWDSLLDSSGTTMWSAADPTKPGIHTQLSGIPISSASGAKLTTTTLTQGQLDSLSRMGITRVYHNDAASTAIPGDRFTIPATLAVGSTVCIINPATTSGKKLIDSIYPANKSKGNASATPPIPAGVPGTLPANKTLVIFGLGPLNGLIGTSMTDVPFYPNVDLTLVYNRNLVAFEVDANGGRADFKAVFGTDGDLKSDMAADMFK